MLLGLRPAGAEGALGAVLGCWNGVVDQPAAGLGEDDEAQARVPRVRLPSHGAHPLERRELSCDARRRDAEVAGKLDPA